MDPLTLTDSHSRYLIEVRIVPPTIEGSQPVFAAAFRHMPRAIRSDNGSPFGSTGAGGLTRLSAWWIKLGIEPHFIHPASPQENGRHERMHRTLKAQTSRPPATNAAEQQGRFDSFRGTTTKNGRTRRSANDRRTRSTRHRGRNAGSPRGW